MKSIVIEISQDGQGKTFAVKEVPMPVMDANSVMVEIKGCGFSHLNSKVLSELFKKSPHVHYPVAREVTGVVSQVGSDVSSIQVGNRVAGILPLDSPCSGCAQYCVFNEYDLVKVPDALSLVEVAACLGDGLRAYTALHYLARLCGGDSVVIMNGASSFGSIAIQLAQHWGAKVLTTASTDEEKLYLGTLQPAPAQVIELGSKSNMLVSGVMEETGGIGVDCIIDYGVQQFTSIEDLSSSGDNYKYPVPTKHEVISSLGVGGRWVTSQWDLQLDPPNSQLLYFRNASVCYLFEHAWALSASQHGRYAHILTDILSKLEKGIIRPNVKKTVGMEDALAALQELEDLRVGKIVLAL